MPQEIKRVEGDPLEYLSQNTLMPTNLSELSGCYWIIPDLVGICFSFESTRIEICLRLAGVDAVCGYLDSDHPSTTLAANVLCAKARIQVSIQDSCLAFEAQACYRDTYCLGSWQCVEATGNIVCWE